MQWIMLKTREIGLLLILAGVLPFAAAQTPAQPPAPPPRQTNPAPAQAPTQSAPKPDAKPDAAPGAGTAPLNEKQKALALETQKLVTMAENLKVQVDKTSRNILSVTVVQQAEDIEHYAHQLKQEAKK
jgi:hypothetical protein